MASGWAPKVGKSITDFYNLLLLFLFLSLSICPLDFFFFFHEMRGTGVWQFVILLVLPQGLFTHYEPHYLKVTFFFFSWDMIFEAIQTFLGDASAIFLHCCRFYSIPGSWLVLQPQFQFIYFKFLATGFFMPIFVAL